jgi:transposase
LTKWLSQSKLYSIVTNRKAKGKKGLLVALVTGTKTKYIILHLSKIDLKKRQLLIKITLDMDNSMKVTAKKCFPKALQVTDRFHFQKSPLEALQEIRIKKPMGSYRQRESIHTIC